MADQLADRLPLSAMQDCLQVRLSSPDPRRAHAAGLLRSQRLGLFVDGDASVSGVEVLMALADELCAAAPTVMVMAARRGGARTRGHGRGCLERRAAAVRGETAGPGLASSLGSTSEIARGMFLSRRTVQTYISHILAKLHAKSRVKIVREALRQGISPKRLHGGRCEQEAAAAKYRQMTTIQRPAQGIPLKGDTQTRGGGMAR